MAKTSQIDRLIAELRSERLYTQACKDLIGNSDDMPDDREAAGHGAAVAILQRRIGVLDEMIGRAVTMDEGADLVQTIGTPKRVREARKARKGLPVSE